MCECKADQENIAVMDMTTPRNAALSGFYKRSFAYVTCKDRLPTILTQTLDLLVRHKDDIGTDYGKQAKEEIKTVVGEVSKLKYEIQTNKPIAKLLTDAPDVPFYNEYLAKQSVNLTYFSAIWLHTECYMYRRLMQIFEMTEHLKAYDPFRIQKEEGFHTSIEPMIQLSRYLLATFSQPKETRNVQDEFVKLIKSNLWGNKCDLSFSSGVVEGATNPFDVLEELEPYIVCDQTDEIWRVASNLTHPLQTIDIVLDNSGFELFTDLCLADFFITNGFAQTVRFYVKAIPWFISDVTTQDFSWTLEQLRKNSNEHLKAIGARWTDYVKNKKWHLVNNDFFTYPCDFSYMASVNPSLYRQLADAKLAIFKGDLNYRKLFGEKNWDPTTSCNEALQGFGPTKICILRTTKSHIICGLKKGVAEKLDETEPDWLISGKYGVIQFCDFIKIID